MEGSQRKHLFNSARTEFDVIGRQTKPYPLGVVTRHTLPLSSSQQRSSRLGLGKLFPNIAAFLIEKVASPEPKVIEDLMHDMGSNEAMI